MKSLHIAVVSSIFPPPYIGGAERSVELLVEELIVAGHRVTVFALQESWRTGVIEDGPLRIVRMRIPNLYWRWGRNNRPGRVREIVWNLIDLMPTLASLRLRSAFKRDVPDLVVTSNISGWAYAPWKVARSLGLPLVHFVRDFSLLCVRSNLLRDGQTCQALCGKCRPRAAASRRQWPGGTAVGISQSVLDNHVVRGLFDQNASLAISHPKHVIGKPGLSDRPVQPCRRIGYLGRISPEKGLEQLLEAAKELGLSVEIGGTGHQGYIEQLSKRFPLARFRGHVDSAKFLEVIDLLVVPSLWEEPFGRVVADATAAGVPCLVSDRGGLVEAAGATGAIYRAFDPDNAAELAHLLAEAHAGTIRWSVGDPAMWPSESTTRLVGDAVA